MRVAARLPDPPPRQAAGFSLDLPDGTRLCALSDTHLTGRARRSLILAFHGGGGDAQRFALRSGLAEAFHAQGHDVAFPQAASHWADGRPPLEEGWPGDRGFVEALVREQAAALGTAGPSPAISVALIGGSNGGIFTLRLACELDPAPRAVVAVAAALSADYAARARPGPPVPVMLVQATEDRFIPWQGGEVPHVPGLSVGGALLGAEATVRFWLRRNRCTEAPTRRRATLGGLPVDIFAWSGAADVWRVVLHGAGHRLLDHPPGGPLEGSLEELIARFVIWHLDPRVRH